MRDVGTFVWVIFIVVGVISSMVSSARKRACRRAGRGHPRPAARVAFRGRCRPLQGPLRPAWPVRPAAYAAPRRRSQAARAADAAAVDCPLRPAARAPALSWPGAASVVLGDYRRRGPGKATGPARRIPVSLTAQRFVDLRAELPDRVRLFGDHDRQPFGAGVLVSASPSMRTAIVCCSPARKPRCARRQVVRRVLEAAVGGAHITPDDVTLALSDNLAQNGASALPTTLVHTHRGREVRPVPPGSGVRAGDRRVHADGRHRSGRHRQDVSRDRDGGARSRRATSRAMILSRPAVEAGETLGFLPGDFREKVDPYLRPLYDALGDLLDDGDASISTWSAERSRSRRSAFMRGRTLSRRVRDPRRGSERHARSDQDVPHALGRRPKMVVTATRRRSTCRGRTQRSARRGRPFSRASPRSASSSSTRADIVRHPLVARSCALRGARSPNARGDPLSQRTCPRSGVDGRALVATARGCSRRRARRDRRSR